MKSIQCLNKKQFLLILASSLMLFIFFTFCKDSLAQDKPYQDNKIFYQSKNEHECLNEKECVWHHFLLAVQNHANPKNISSDLALHKWSGPIRIRIIGKKDKLSAKMYQDYINQIFPYIPQKISIETKYNFLIVETNDIEKDINTEFKQIALAALTPNNSLRNSGMIEVKKGAKCHNFFIATDKNKKSIEGYLSFIKEDDETMEPCLKEMVYEGFGISSIKASPIFKGERFSSEYSDLELFILYLFHNDAIQSNRDVNEIKKDFDQFYKPALNYFNRKKGLIK